MPCAKTLPRLLWPVALILACWIFRQLPLAAIAQHITELSPEQWLAWIGLNLGIVLMATQRWRVLSHMLALPVGFGELLMIRQAGQAVSFITPGPQFGGEPLQVFWLYKRRQLPIQSTSLALGLDRFFELWVNFSVLLLGVVLLLASPVSGVIHWQEISWWSTLILLGLSLLGWILLKRPDRIFSLLKQVAVRWRQHPRLQQLESHGQRIGNDVRRVIAEKKPALFHALLLSLGGWGGLLAELWLLLSFFHLALGFSGFLVVLVSMRLAFLLPLPGGIGTLEAALFAAFQYLNLSAEAAIGLIALMRLRDGVMLAAGLWSLRVMQMRK